jgi:hypothetical protein
MDRQSIAVKSESDDDSGGDWRDPRMVPERLAGMNI